MYTLFYNVEDNVHMCYLYNDTNNNGYGNHIAIHLTLIYLVKVIPLTGSPVLLS